MIQNNKKKQGVTLAVLIITVVVALILLSVSIVAIKSSVDNASLVAFAQDLSTITEQSQTYFVQQDAFPTLSGAEAALSQKEILALSSNADKMKLELQSNTDYVENNDLGAFYKVDLGKLNVTKAIRGVQKNNNNKDIYVVSYPSMNVYYLDGFRAKGDYYYSLSPKLSKQTKITRQELKTATQQIAGITIKKELKTWTNKLGISMQAIMNPSETLFIKFSGGGEKQVTTTQGINTFSFNTIEELKSIVPAISDAEINAMDNGVSQDIKYMEILKKKNDVEIGKMKVEFSNYERVAPIKLTEPQISYNKTENVVDFKVSDTVSGIKEVRYEYLKVYDKDGNVQNYYDGLDVFDENYMKSRAKIGGTQKDGVVSLKIPKDVEGLQILIVDRAGNWISMTKAMYPGNTMHVGVIPKDISLTKATFKYVVNSSLGVNNVTTYISPDGINWDKPLTTDFATNDTITYKVINDYVGLNGYTDKIYIKVLAINNNPNVALRIKEERVVCLTKDDSVQEGTKNKFDSTWNNPYIPVGFEHTEGTVEDGFVIKDVTGNVQTEGNEFVWIPVRDINSFYRKSPSLDVNGKIKWDKYGYFSENESTAEYVSMKTSVQNHGGFYIARYEAGVATNMPQTKPTASTESYANGEYKPVSKKNTAVWNILPWGGSRTENTGTDGLGGNDRKNGIVKASRCIYPNIKTLKDYGLQTNLTSNTDVVSTLCYDVQWDAMMYFLQDIKNPNDENKPYITNSKMMGNLNSTEDGQRPALTGDSKYPQYVTKNIYDVAGNVLEFTMAGLVNENSGIAARMYRGACFIKYGTEPYCNASSKDNNHPDAPSVRFGFRPALYIN
ncbi:MAG: hypothetical protein RSE00_02760 [Clostridia bacterium]